jgi:hypothetical protein
MLIAQAIVNNSEEVSLAVQGAWQNTWELAFNGTLYQALTNLGLIPKHKEEATDDIREKGERG